MTKGNPAVIGLGGFGLTTMILQFHNLGWVGIGPVLWIGLLYGGTAQLVAGFLEFGTGNNFGLCAFTGYGAFWIALCFFVIFGTSSDIVAKYPTLKLDARGLGVFLVMFTIFTGILWIASIKHHLVLNLIFLTLFLGFLGLDFKELAGSKALGTLAAWDLIVCACLALYLMAHVVYAEAGIHLTIGAPKSE